jgi:hypothetical protein
MLIALRTAFWKDASLGQRPEESTNEKAAAPPTNLAKHPPTQEIAQSPAVIFVEA